MGICNPSINIEPSTRNKVKVAIRYAQVSLTLSLATARNVKKESKPKTSEWAQPVRPHIHRISSFLSE